jgi:hypothetical protein
LTKPDVHRVTNIDLTYARVQVIYNFDQKSLPTNAPDRWPLRVRLERIRKRRFDPIGSDRQLGDDTGSYAKVARRHPNSPDNISMGYHHCDMI